MGWARPCALARGADHEAFLAGLVNRSRHCCCSEFSVGPLITRAARDRRNRSSMELFRPQPEPDERFLVVAAKRRPRASEFQHVVVEWSHGQPVFDHRRVLRLRAHYVLRARMCELRWAAANPLCALRLLRYASP